MLMKQSHAVKSELALLQPVWALAVNPDLESEVGGRTDVTVRRVVSGLSPSHPHSKLANSIQAASMYRLVPIPFLLVLQRL
jgi:hypothetical protein